MQSIPEDTSQGAVRREWPLPFSRTATPDWILWDAPFGRAGKRSPAVLRLWARGKAIPGKARLALNRFPTRCIRNYYLDRVLVRRLFTYSFTRLTLGSTKVYEISVSSNPSMYSTEPRKTIARTIAKS